MNIALIAHDNKKELMEALCIAYKWILEKHTIFATGSTGATVSEGADLIIEMFDFGELGEEQIAARIAYNEMDLVIYFRDFDDSYGMVSETANSIRALCDLNNIPLATNMATAEILLNGLERGDFEWRELVNPAK